MDLRLGAVIGCGLFFGGMGAEPSALHARPVIRALASRANKRATRGFIYDWGLGGPHNLFGFAKETDPTALPPYPRESIRYPGLQIPEAFAPLRNASSWYARPRATVRNA